MNQDDREDTTIYKVVMNHEEQYSIWPADRENALGCRFESKTSAAWPNSQMCVGHSL
jgi:MbtH protein